LPGINAPAYYENSKVTAAKSFIKCLSDVPTRFSSFLGNQLYNGCPLGSNHRGLNGDAFNKYRDAFVPGMGQPVF
jgi:hypothetical protein